MTVFERFSCLVSHGDQLMSVTATLKKGDPSALPAGQAIVDFKRRVLLSNPVIDFDQIVAVQRIRPGTADKPDALCTQVGLANNCSFPPD